jgi:chemotaxis protein MotD
LAANGAVATPAPTGTDAAAKTGEAKAATNAAAVGEAVATQIAAADTIVTTGITPGTSATKVAAKTASGLKTGIVAKDGTARTGEQDTSDTSTAATPAGTASAITPQAASAGKPKTGNGIVDTVKADASGNSASASAAANADGNGPAVTADPSQAPVNSPDSGLQAAGTLQPQQSAAHTPAAQLTVTAATHAAVPLSGLAMEIAASAKSGKSRFEIRLDPADLGRIDVRIDVDRNGQVTSHLTVERPETLSMLRQDANQLQRALDNAGLSTGNSGLQFSLRDQSSQGQNDGGQSNPNAHRLIVSEEDNIPAAVAGRSYGRMLGASGGVDIRI